jgi:hypothetical protein
MPPDSKRFTKELVALYRVTVDEMRWLNVSTEFVIWARDLAKSEATIVGPEHLCNEWARLKNRVQELEDTRTLSLLFFNEIAISRDVDHFEIYLTQILYRIFRERPETLRTSDQLKYADILECSNMDDLLHLLAEKKTIGLAYSGYVGIRQFLEKSLGLPLSRNSKMEHVITEAIEVRNIIVHNKGLVNRSFQQRTGRTDLPIGILFPLDASYCNRANVYLIDLAEEIDAAVCAHFSIAVP